MCYIHQQLHSYCNCNDKVRKSFSTHIAVKKQKKTYLEEVDDDDELKSIFQKHVRLYLRSPYFWFICVLALYLLPSLCHTRYSLDFLKIVESIFS